MKKIPVVVALVLLVASGSMFAQVGPMGRGWGISADQPGSSKVTVEGKLALVNGEFAVQSGKNTFYVPWIGRYAGFIDGLKEGAQVKIAGISIPLERAPEYSMLIPGTLTVNGKDYDLSSTSRRMGGFCGNNGGPRNGGNGGFGSRGDRW